MPIAENLAVEKARTCGKVGLRGLCGRFFLCSFPLLPDPDDRHFSRRKVLVQNVKRIQEAGSWGRYNEWLAMDNQGENSGAPNWWYRPEGRRQRLGSREGLNQGFDAMDDRQETGSSETAGRNRYPRLNVSQGEYSPMLKPLTLSLSLAVALGFCSVSMAGIGDGCSTCGLASPQGGPMASAQGPVATCDTGCAPRNAACSVEWATILAACAASSKPRVIPRSLTSGS